MAAPDTTVKYYHSGMSGAPVLSGTAGALIGVLDTLINGFGSVTADSVVVAGGIATFTRAAGISFEKDAVILAAGATPAGLNGEKRILSITGTTFTFDATGISDQTATGTITAKMAPAGWEKQYSGTNLAAYRSTNAASYKPVLRVDDTAAQTARVVGYESMTAISTGINPFPNNSQQSGGAYWDKSDAASGAARKWILIADDRAFHLCLATYSASVELHSPYSFGEHVSFRSGDAYPGYLTGLASSSPGSAPGSTAGHLFIPSATGVWIQRDAGGLSLSPQTAYSPSTNPYTGTPSGNASYYPPYPGTTHGSIMCLPLYVKEGNAATSDIRGTIPGVLYLASGINPATFSSRTKLAAEGELAGKILYFLECASASSCRGAFNIIGPWR